MWLGGSDVTPESTSLTYLLAIEAACPPMREHIVIGCQRLL
ncbi:hypothetical protein ACFQ3W_16245 [Paenibacillus puldeungensis]|uniref:Uncharacterized protein n=1 Tax=Paenibacillus puldeungensis TaxID=696536 RepID=A0ABW3S0C1_9BACL